MNTIQTKTIPAVLQSFASVDIGIKNSSGSIFASKPVKESVAFPLDTKPILSKCPILCFSHLRWDFVLQRPQHLLGRFAQTRPVYFFEEFITTDHTLPYLEMHAFKGTTVTSIRPRIPQSYTPTEREGALKGLVDQLVAQLKLKDPVLWFYTPMMWPIAAHLKASAVVYDCMDELSAFRFAPPELRQNEADLMRHADVVFTGGYSLYEAKKTSHENVHPFPSSVDTAHFNTARTATEEPEDQAWIPGPRLGYYGVIDERLDLNLIEELADRRPEWSIIMVGPVVKLAPHDLPQRGNIHYLGQKTYEELPKYLSGWDVALMPFAINEATRFISPTKTPEYLAGGRAVVSTPVRDVVRHYGALKGVHIAEDAQSFIALCDDALRLTPSTPDAYWLKEVDALLSTLSWDKTFQNMDSAISEATQRKKTLSAPERAATPNRRRAVRNKPYDVVVVGAGFAGSVLAERLASVSGQRVLVCDKRPHVAGNAYDYYNEAGILIHKYGPHIFHTNSDEIVKYLSKFTRWRPYEHRVLSDIGGQRLPMPINRTTLNGVFNLSLQSDDEAADFLTTLAEPVEKILNSRDVVLSQVGEKLYKTFFEGYTRKQWGLDPSELDKSVTSRVPTRTSLDDRYFLDTFQAMPLEGYTKMFERILDHEYIDLELGTDFNDLKTEDLAPLTIYTGPIDTFFDYKYGKLPYRSLDFVHETHDKRLFQDVAVVNYPSENVPYTRITEYKHLTGQLHAQTSISYEFAKAEGEPYYPVPRPANQALYKRYEELAKTRNDVVFLGRLGTYKYYNMDQVVGQALATHRRLATRLETREGHSVSVPVLQTV
jgi:UDP-galactopyranose mutase